MAKQIARLLKTNMMADIDMPSLAQFLQSQGRKGDSILAHINPKEAALLQKMGGAGTANPSTGLPEFYEDAPYMLTPDRPDELYVDVPDRKTNDFYTKYGDIDFNTRDYNDPIENIALGGQPFDPYSQTQKDIVRTISDRSPSSNVTTTFPMSRLDEFDALNQRDSSFQTITPDYLSDFNLGGTGEFTQIPDFSRSVIDTEFPTVPKTEEKNILRRGVDYLKELTGLSGNELARLGLAGGLGIQGALASREMAKQGQEARREQEAIAAPYRERGAALLAQAEGGQLTPQAQQSLQAMRARLQQGVESRGGVGAQQAAAQVEAFRQQLLANQFDYGMKVSNIGDQIAMGAIRTGLEADRYASKMTSDYFTNMAKILAGMGEEESPVTQQTQVRGAR